MRDQRAEVSLNISPERELESEPLESRDFRLLLLGDFSGRGNAAPLTNDMPRRVDRDDLDAHVARIAPRLRIDLANARVDLAFASMDDFHPDHLAARLSALVGAVDASTPIAPPPPAAGRDTPTPDIARALSGGSLLDDMLDDTAGPSLDDRSAVKAPRTVRHDELSAFVERAVAPHLVPAPSARDAARAESDKQLQASLLRGVLHHPRVQALEAAWRSIEMLVRRLDTDGSLDVFLFDVPRDQIASALERVAARRSATDDESWAMVVALHDFDEADDAANAIAHIAMAARTLGTPCIAAAPLSFTGARSLDALNDDEQVPSPAPDVYSLIRGSLEARFLGLTFPRVLLRAPYGRENPCDTMDFEELDDAARHGDYLWGSGAALVALLVGEAFNERGWAMGPRIPLDVGSLPYFTYRGGPETVAKSCAEMIMSERIARHLLSRGLMPVAWIKDTDRVRVVEIRSVATPTAPLAAAWAGSTGVHV
jgi:type VI secretion system protein ImpC